MALNDKRKRTSPAPPRGGTSKELMANAYENATVVLSFNIPHLPMMAPITITNPSKTDPIVMLKHFGPDNPDLDLI